jgi:hypothetical protein
LPIAPPTSNSGTNIALTPPEPSEKIVASSFNAANASSTSVGIGCLST